MNARFFALCARKINGKRGAKMNKAIENKIGSNIRVLREKANYTQEEVASLLQVRGCDITRSALAKIEVGQRHLYPDEIVLLREIFNVSYDEIFALT